jgi:dTDP-4-dehydrorhamnose 3,5-epimerase
MYKISKQRLPGVRELSNEYHSDKRGGFREWTNPDILTELENFHPVQVNIVKSNLNTIRGLHLNRSPHEQAKLITCVSGKIKDVLVDLRPDLESFGFVEYFELSEENHKSIYIPEGIAHGYSVLSDVATVIYQVSRRYDKASEIRLNPLDTKLSINWSLHSEPILSEQDKNGVSFADFKREIKN